MDIDFADLLMEVVHRRASDLHLASGAHPTVRVRGKLSPLEDYPQLSSTDTREIIYSILTGDQRQRLETDWQLDSPTRSPVTRASASTPTSSAARSGRPSA
jgi:twitching motility protein PilT